MHRACLSRLVFDVCKYLFAGNVNTREERGGQRGCNEKRRRRAQRRDDDDDGGYTLNCSAEIDGVSSLPLERFVCPTYAARTRVYVYRCMCVCVCVSLCPCIHVCVTAPRRASRWWRHRVVENHDDSLILSKITRIFISINLFL